MLFLLLLISAIGALAVPAPGPAPTPAPTASLTTNTARDYAPDLTLDLPTISIEPFTLSSLNLPSTTFSLSLDLPTNTCTPTVTPDSNGYVPPGNCNALYAYYPSFAAAVAFSVLFGILLIAHFMQATIYKAAFVWVILLGAAWECTGFVTRAVSTKNQQDTTVLTVTQMFILTAPICMSTPSPMLLTNPVNMNTCSGQRLRLHGPGADDKLLHPRAAHRDLQAVPSSSGLRLPRHRRLRHPAHRRRNGNAHRRRRDHEKGPGHLHGWHRDPAVLHRVLHRHRDPIPPPHAATIAGGTTDRSKSAVADAALCAVREPPVHFCADHFPAGGVLAGQR
ncbi:uncharacterized protein DSM5745_09083 [Aspergillus mulundensis]|uniref:Uncharacterized protein n=1 Tax=Aspergillus mulundensis TaxID=1810919 RepID=A0A3D8QZM1_9EURO|nr:hypothetical protein DSM5745_09083 [Aspergillus mulundensis]RDW67217.1 hypothetical protein DSM5745_09083 [Aspergillus mulundensis]